MHLLFKFTLLYFCQMQTSAVTVGSFNVSVVDAL